MSVLRRAPALGRRALFVALGLLVTLAIVVAFSGNLSRSTDAEAQAERARATLAAIQDAHRASEDELAFVQTPEFVRWQARAYGMGDPGERPFRLEPGAPTPAPIMPIGPQDAGPRTLSPFDAWMELLFGDRADDSA